MPGIKAPQSFGLAFASGFVMLIHYTPFPL
jgi:hypothetical protein